MRRLVCLPIAILLVALLAVGVILFPVPRPELELAANYSHPFFKIGPFPITNSIITAWVTMLVLIGLLVVGTGRMKLVPRGLQNVVEWLLETLLNFVESVAGSKNARRFFPVIATIFLFVAINAWTGLLPGYGTIGYGKIEEYSGAFFGHRTGFIVTTPLLRPANTDVNFPFAVAAIAFVFIEFWGIRSLGFRHYAGKFVRLKQVGKGFGSLFKGRVKEAVGGFLFGAIDVFVGALELLSEFIRVISFTFRLFGNMTAGEILLLVIAFLVPWVLGGLVFYPLETFIGFVQALVFAGLTLVFVSMAVLSHEEEH